MKLTSKRGPLTITLELDESFFVGIPERGRAYLTNVQPSLDTAAEGMLATFAEAKEKVLKALYTKK